MSANIYVEVGLIPDNPVPVASAFKLDDASFGLLDTGTLSTAIFWSPVSSDVVSFTVTRNSTRQQGPLWNYQAGTCSILLDNSDGTYDPDNASGVFYGQLSPMVPVRIRADTGNTAYPVYSGFADGWFPAEVTYQGEYAELTLSATDAFKVLTGVILTTVPLEGVATTTGARIRDILTRSGWYTSAEKNRLDTGNSTLQGTTLGSDALSLMQLANDSEIGQLYVDGSGAVVFRARRALLLDSRSNTVQAVFGDSPDTVHTAGTELAIASHTRAVDDTTIINDVQAAVSGGTTQEVTDAASIVKYLFPRTYSRTDLITQSDSDALNWAQYVLYIGKASENRIDTLKINPNSDPDNLWPQVLERDIGDRIQVWIRPSGVSGPITKDCFIAGVQHDWNSANQQWVTTWTLQDASKYGSFMVLDNASLGALDSNALSF